MNWENIILNVIWFWFGFGIAKGWYHLQIKKYVVSFEVPLQDKERKEVMKFFGKNTLILNGKVEMKKI